MDSMAGQISVGAYAGLMLTMGVISRQVEEANRVKVPHMLYDQLKWAKQAPQKHPTCSLTITVSVRGYQNNGYKPPPVTRRRQTNMSVLADTGCQACCMGPTQLHSLGMSESDLLEPVLNLRAANTSGIDILGAVFLHIFGWDKSGRQWDTHQLCYWPATLSSCSCPGMPVRSWG